MEEKEQADMARETAENKLVEDAFKHLLDDYLATRHRKKVDIITRAFNFARQAHKGVRRLSGEPYIMHPIAVAQIACSEMGLGSTSISAALLHDVVEDTDYTVEDIENIFGHKIALIVDGLTKISGGIFGEQASAQAENFKKLLLTMSDDIRVILIKICDRLHNMRTLDSQPANKQYKIAGETLYIYAPLANRLGLNKIKTELENLSFKFEHPEEYRSIQEKLADTQASRDELFADFTAPIRQALDKMGLEYDIKARVKSPYSIWNKMQNKHVNFDQIYDILAVRIIFKPKKREEEVNECFNIYVAINQIYKSHPDRLRDWVSHPKANGYQALHVTLMSKQGRWIEVQIRSDHMNEVAEQGFAAHWKYKSGDEITEDEGELNNWLSTIKEILDDPQPDAMDFLDAIKLNLFASEIFVFTPKGEIKTLPAGCTALDFAFQIHTFLGSHCIGAKVNHKLVPLSHRLQSGDQVEILTSKTQKVTADWMEFATTAKAKSKIQAILRRERRELQKKGEEILADFFAKTEREPNSLVVDRICQLHAMPSREDLCAALGASHIVLGDEDLAVISDKSGGRRTQWSRYLSFFKRGRNKQAGQQETGEALPPIDRKKTLLLSEETMKRCIICDECHPIPGDDVLGILDDDGRITIHKRQCAIADKLKTTGGNRILAAEWDTHKQLYFPATIHLNGIDRLGVLHSITGVLSQQLNINIRQLHIETNDGIFYAEIQLEVHDVEDLTGICQDLKRIAEIEDVKRF